MKKLILTGLFLSLSVLGNKGFAAQPCFVGGDYGCIIFLNQGLHNGPTTFHAPANLNLATQKGKVNIGRAIAQAAAELSTGEGHYTVNYLPQSNYSSGDVIQTDVGVPSGEISVGNPVACTFPDGTTSYFDENGNEVPAPGGGGSCIQTVGCDPSSDTNQN